MEDLLTTDQLAKYLQMNPVTVRRKAANGEIPAIKIGKQIRFDKAQIDRWLLKKRMAKIAQILVVDDEAVVGDLIKDVLEMGGYQVTTTLNSLESLEIINKNQFELIFLDLLMPELDGSEVFKRIREIDKDVPVVIVTGYPDSEIISKALQHGPFLVIKKPFVVEDILNVVHTVNRDLAISNL